MGTFVMVSHRTILCVDDDPIFGNQLSAWLGRAGFRTVLSASAEEGLASVLRVTPEIAIIDWNLPGVLSGLDLCATLHRMNAQIGIIMLTGRDDPHDVARALCQGADHLVS